MLVSTFLVALVVSAMVLFLLRKDHLLSPAKFIVFLNIAYMLVPITLGGILHIAEDNLYGIFPSLYDDNTNTTMLYVYIYSILSALLIRAAFSKVNFKSINNAELEDGDYKHATVSGIFLAAGMLFIGIAIAMVGFDSYRDYVGGSTEAIGIIGGNVVAQSFKSQGEITLSLFSIPVILYLYKRNKLLLTILFVALIGISVLGGARKFIVAPSIFLLFLVAKEGGSKNFYLKVVPLTALIALSLSLIQNLRSGVGASADFGSAVYNLLEQFTYAFLVPSGFLYFNSQYVENAEFSLFSFLEKLVLNPIIYVLPRFLFPDKDDLLIEDSQNLVLDYASVGGDSFISYFLSDSYGSLFLAIPLMALAVTLLFRWNQSSKSGVTMPIYFGTLINSFGFTVNLGYVVAAKVFLSQILLEFLIFTLIYRFLFRDSEEQFGTSPAENQQE